MITELPTACNVGTKRNSKGYKTSWTGYKLHIDAADGGIPVSCILTSVSLHDSQAAIPLAEITHGRVTNLYDMMDAAYDAPQIVALTVEQLMKFVEWHSTARSILENTPKRSCSGALALNSRFPLSFEKNDVTAIGKTLE